MPRVKKPRVARLDEVSITREAEAALIEHHDPTIGSTSLILGARVHTMTKAEILDEYNDTVRARERAAAEHENVVLEVAPGFPQVEYSKRSDQWVPRGEVLRCVIEDGGPRGEPTIWIDEREFSLQEFGRMLTTFAGWGMRIAFVAEERLDEEPRVNVGEPPE